MTTLETLELDIIAAPAGSVGVWIEGLWRYGGHCDYLLVFGMGVYRTLGTWLFIWISRRSPV